MHITVEHILRAVEEVALLLKDQRDYLTQLDAAIGDADHGTNMDRGFSAVVAKLPSVSNKNIGEIFKMMGTTLVSTVGGASGPLYGTAFLRAGVTAGDRFSLAPDDVIAMMEAGLAGIQARGKAQRGEKTIIDAMAPSIDALKESWTTSGDFRIATHAFAAAAQQGMEATIPMVATKGRASYLGERSVGHQDPGATSYYFMAQAIQRVMDSYNE